MTILKGFPPSNTISPGTRIPIVVETKAIVGELNDFEKFKDEYGEFMLMYKKRKVIAICYKSYNNHLEAGGLYCADIKKEVIWLKNVY